jgi:hypothetical protein avisC_06387
MSFLPDLAGASRAARADLGVLYRLALPTDPGGRSGHAVLRFRAPFEIDGAEPVDAPEALAVGRRFTVRVVAEKRHQDSEGRSRSRPVFDEEAEAWARGLLARRGIGADAVVVSERWRVGSPGERPRSQRTRRTEGGRRADPPRGRSFTVRDLTATITGLAEGCDAYTRGIGRGKAFGYGMPIVL